MEWLSRVVVFNPFDLEMVSVVPEHIDGTRRRLWWLIRAFTFKLSSATIEDHSVTPSLVR